MEVRGDITVVEHGDGHVVGVVNVLLGDEGGFGGDGRYLAVDLGAAITVVFAVEVLRDERARVGSIQDGVPVVVRVAGVPLSIPVKCLLKGVGWRRAVVGPGARRWPGAGGAGIADAVPVAVHLRVGAAV